MRMTILFKIRGADLYTGADACRLSEHEGFPYQLKGNPKSKHSGHISPPNHVLGEHTVVIHDQSIPSISIEYDGPWLCAQRPN